MIPDDVTSVAIHVGYETRPLYESPSKDYVLVPDCCYGSGRDNTTGHTKVVRFLSLRVNEPNDGRFPGQDVRQHFELLRAAAE